MIDFKKTALVLIDLQKGILEMPTAPHSQDTIMSNAKAMVDLFRQEGAFITFVALNFTMGKINSILTSWFNFLEKDLKLPSLILLMNSE
ncbi:isochorismatase family protein [Streptococcus dysgalactiae]|uniref:isochorismatase family protein n=1 Tax=Streptococcus dysgalactiae TaxID=1334 RepID=UPI0022B253B9|nr:isochorismatase family protein [Streptococcus dysgalactiae]